MTAGKALLISVGGFVAIIVAVALVWALAGSDTALILGLIVFVAFYGCFFWLWRKFVKPTA
jgi:hypothetical protein